ncbi:MAG: hypothetical protein ACI3Y2_06780 [Candidatus Egerieousia sp.]
MYYNFNLYKFAAELVPAIMRKKFLYALLKALLSPLLLLCESLTVFRESVLVKTAYNAITIYLEKFLNDTLATTGIWISDYVIENTLYLAHKAENKPYQYLSHMSEDKPYVYISNNNGLIGAFAVHVPAAVATSENLYTIRRWVDFYKYAGTQYEIIIY